MNRLAKESSPYLLQHTTNPVDWWPWSDAAFEEASRRGVPVFLSIGYSTCYWCHVMERESFENEGIAALMNAKFVSIKVDREERPEVDELYMAATVISTGHGGWPMSVFLDPTTRRPFWCGTYFPPSASPMAPDRPTFPQVLEGMSRAFEKQRSDVDAQAAEIAGAVAEQVSTVTAGASIGASTISDAASMLVRMFDRNHGGFSGAPKFPQPVLLSLLLDVRGVSGEEATRTAVDAMVRTSLDAMMLGGLCDQAAGGFHRYCVDGHWTVPHFEKMLYDNAMLMSVYARAAKVYSEPHYERVARRTLAWMDREMMTGDGLLAAALDAEVSGREGASHVWNPAEVRAAAGDLADLAVRVYGLHLAPNFRDPHHPKAAAAHVLRYSGRPDDLARELGMDVWAMMEKVDAANERLLKARNARPQPRRDDKAIAAWNGMALVGMADAAEAFGDDGIATRAGALADAVMRRMVGEDGSVIRTLTGSVRGPSGTLEDYAWVALGLMRVAAVVKDSSRAAELRACAARVVGEMERRFRDAATGVLFDVEVGRGDLFVRPRSTHDGATPCGTSVAVHAMLELGDEAEQRAVETLASISGSIAASPVGCANSVRALMKVLAGGGAGALAREGGASLPSGVASAASSEVVEVLAAEERVTVGVDSPVMLTLRVRVKEGWHLAAADSAGMTAFRVGVVGGTGVRVYADYPEGVAGLAGVADGERAYAGEFELPVVVEREGEWSGTPILVVSFQACGAEVCLAPAKVELDIAVDRG